MTDLARERLVLCPACKGHGEPEGDGHGWDGTSMHTPACECCDGRLEVPGEVAAAWPFNRNHEAARRHVNQVLRDHGRPDYSRRETQIAELLDESIAERDAVRRKLAAVRLAADTVLERLALGEDVPDDEYQAFERALNEEAV